MYRTQSGIIVQNISIFKFLSPTIYCQIVLTTFWWWFFYLIISAIVKYLSSSRINKMIHVDCVLIGCKKVFETILCLKFKVLTTIHMRCSSFEIKMHLRARTDTSTRIFHLNFYPTNLQIFVTVYYLF